MARPLRIAYPGAIYHLMARGNQGGPVIVHPGDREFFYDADAAEVGGAQDGCRGIAQMSFPRLE